MDNLDNTQKDFLTGFFTREHLISMLRKKMAEAKLESEQFSILLVDIDHFKKINDKYGHLWGDEFLKYVASTLRLTLEDKGLIFRYGGDEFVILFSEHDPKKVFSLAKQFNVVMRNRPFLFNGHLFKITISCGQATYPDVAQTPEALLKAADDALYFSKRYGRNTTTCADKIGLHKFRIIAIVFLEVFLLAGLIFFGRSFPRKGLFRRPLGRFSIKRFLPIGLKADATIILKSGDVVLGHIISEDKDKLVVDVYLGQGRATINIEKILVQSIIPNKQSRQ